MEKQLPKTLEYLNHMEDIFCKYYSNPEEYESFSDNDKGVIMNPMLHFAEIISMESPGWAEDLAKYLCILCNIKRLDIEINVK